MLFTNYTDEQNSKGLNQPVCGSREYPCPPFGIAFKVSKGREERKCHCLLQIRFHITLPRRVAMFVGKLGTTLQISQLRGELDNPITGEPRNKVVMAMSELDCFIENTVENSTMLLHTL